jgi:hypothetical protein
MFAKSIKRFGRLCLLTLVSLTLQCLPVAARAVYYSEESLMAKCSWVVTAHTKKLPNYLKYPGSQLCPLTQVRFSYYVKSSDAEKGPSRWEDLWYHDGTPVGCHRYTELDLGPNPGIGAVFVPASADDTDTRTLANALIRLSLDLTLRKCGGTPIVVPEDICQQLVTDFGAFGFHQRNVSSGYQLSIHLVSNPTKFDDFLYMDKPNEH